MCHRHAAYATSCTRNLPPHARSHAPTCAATRPCTRNLLHHICSHAPTCATATLLMLRLVPETFHLTFAHTHLLVPPLRCLCYALYPKPSTSRLLSTRTHFHVLPTRTHLCHHAAQCQGISIWQFSYSNLVRNLIVSVLVSRQVSRRGILMKECRWIPIMTNRRLQTPKRDFQDHIGQT